MKVLTSIYYFLFNNLCNCLYISSNWRKYDKYTMHTFRIIKNELMNYIKNNLLEYSNAEWWNVFLYFCITIQSNILFIQKTNLIKIHILDSERSDECISFTKACVFFFFLYLLSTFEELKVLQLSTLAYFLVENWIKLINILGL